MLAAVKYQTEMQQNSVERKKKNEKPESDISIHMSKIL